jgi:hypothetical protein
MRPLLLIGCFLLAAFMALYGTGLGGMTQAYAAGAALGSLLLSLR